MAADVSCLDSEFIFEPKQPKLCPSRDVHCVEPTVQTVGGASLAVALLDGVRPMSFDRYQV